jgi:hypothetical protein
MKIRHIFATALVALGLVLSMTALDAQAQPTRSRDMTFYAFSPLNTAVLSAYGRIDDGKYCREVLNNSGSPKKVRFVQIKSGEGPTFILKAHKQRTICVALGDSKNTHYAILLIGREITQSSGVWTPQMTRIHYANRQRHADIVCSHNPLKRPAVLNVRKASMNGSWKLADFTAHYVQPGGKACLMARQKPGVYMRLRSEWRRGHVKSRQTYEVAPVYAK